ncbi:MAG TPA: SpoIIE family protein phosphatase [Terriglobales bacterium]|nr:SpoIIE family protein phosphatase [Terriglobales bacterium]
MRLYRFLRRKFALVVPTSLLGQLALYLLAVNLVLVVLHGIWVLAKPGPEAGGDLPEWITFFNVLLVGMYSILLVRWMRGVLLWRLRNRLIVTYFFVGVVPAVLLVAMALISFYIFAGQFATFLVTSDLQAEVKALQSANASRASALAGSLRRGRGTSASVTETRELETSLPVSSKTQVVAWYRGRPFLLQGEPGAQPLAVPGWLKENFSGVALDESGLYLRATTSERVGNETMTVITSMPLDKEVVDRIAAGLGRTTFYITGGDFNVGADFEPTEAGERPMVQLEGQREGTEQRGVRVRRQSSQPAPARSSLSVEGGRLPPRTRWLDRPVTFGALFLFADWKTGEETASLFAVRTRPSALYARLFGTFGAWAGAWAVALAALAVFLAIIALVAVAVAIGLTRTVTGSVHALYQATQHINRGDLSYRIAVRQKDQLAELESSFNSMSTSLQRLLVEEKEKNRLQSELAIAQEVQNQLFPREFPAQEGLEVHGICRPARIVSGDYYDFLVSGSDRLGIALGDISGKGISAALLMATLHSAVRAFQISGVPERVAATTGPGAERHEMSASGASLAVASANGAVSPGYLLEILNHHLYRSTTPEKYATLFLGSYDGRARKLQYSNAGHLPPIVLRANGEVERLREGGTVLGMFDELTFEEGSVELRPGDIFLAFSDGITEPENEFGEFGETRLIELVQENRHLPLPQITDAVVGAVNDWIAGTEQPDDITLVLARGKSSG